MTTSSYALMRAERLFHRLDLDDDGSITLGELLEVMERGGLSAAAAKMTAAKLIGRIDLDRSHSIEKDEFVHYFKLEEVRIYLILAITLSYFRH